MIHHANDDNFKELIARNGTVLIDFYAAWCGPCKAMTPALEAFAAENPDITVVKVDVDEAHSSALGFKIRSVPTLTVIRGGAIVAQRPGAANKAQLVALCSQ